MDFVVKVLVLAILWVTPTSVYSAPRVPRLSLAEPMPSYYYTNIDGYPGTYAFGYDVSDNGNNQYRHEERYPNGTVVGSYGYIDPMGRGHRYRYISDEKGYRVMRDPPRESSPVPMTAMPNQPPDQESSVTWSRKKNNKMTPKIIKPERRNYAYYPTNYINY